MKYKLLDYSYGNLRLLNSKLETIIMDRETLEKIINSQKLKTIKEKKHKYPHLVLDNV
jgi:hypothetical protein